MMESEPAAKIHPAPGQAAVGVGLPSNTRGASSYTSSRFHGDGVRYRAKLIGMDPVSEAQGEKMCWDSMMKLKGIEAAARKQGQHKPRVWLKICSSGLKIVDEKTGVVIQDHDRNKISSLTKDESDPRALAYIYQHENAYVLFYFKMANLAYPVLLDIKEVCQKVDQVTSQEPAGPQNISLVPLDDSSASPAQDAALRDVFSPQPDSSQGLSGQASSRNELMEVFSSQLEEPLSPTQSPCADQPETPQQMLSAAQILSMFPTHPVGGAPYSPSAYPPNTMPLGQQGLLGNQWGGRWPTMPGAMPAWAPPGVTVPPPGGQQAHHAMLPHPGFMVGGSPAGYPATPPYMNGYPSPLNSPHPPTTTGGGPGSPSLDNQSLL